ncbi:MAG: FAD-dependent oxidoreductase [Thermoguttaceae bacterium]
MQFSELTRRDLFKQLALGSGSLSLGAMAANSAFADIRARQDAPAGQVVTGDGAMPCAWKDGKIVRPARVIPQISETDVLVVGGGAAGTTAAIAAARAGAKVALVERYGHFGGLITGGLVLKILSHRSSDIPLVGRGLTEEMLQRLEKMPNGLNRDYRTGEPELDAEVYKYLLVEMLSEAGIDVYLHSWALDAIMEGDICRGAVFQTKMGPHAIIAKQTIDTTGDGDIFAAAGCEHENRTYWIGLVHRIGNLDKAEPPSATKKPRGLGDSTPIPGVNWVNMSGPDGDGLDVKTLSKLEMNHRKQIWKQVQSLRNTPGYEKTYLVETAPQIGVRVTRVLRGVHTLTLEDAEAKKSFDDCIGFGGAWVGEHPAWQIPYRVLVPQKIDNLLTAGRSASAEPKMSELIRVIVPCWITGQAAGCAAALAAQTGSTARDVDYLALRKLLLEQKVFLG